MSFIAIEGLDASGKHTQTENLRAYFEKQGRDVTKIEFPQYNSVSGEIIRGFLTGDWDASLISEPKTKTKSEIDVVPAYHNDVGTYLFQCAQLVNRVENLPDEIWGPHAMKVFIADRYNASAFAYGTAKGIDLDWLLKSHGNLPQPDLNIFLDISVEESFRRRPARRDNYERNRTMLNRVRDCYLNVFKTFGPSYEIIDASGEIEQTFAAIINVIERHKLL